MPLIKSQRRYTMPEADHRPSRDKSTKVITTRRLPRQTFTTFPLRFPTLSPLVLYIMAHIMLYALKTKLCILLDSPQSPTLPRRILHRLRCLLQALSAIIRLIKFLVGFRTRSIQLMDVVTISLTLEITAHPTPRALRTPLFVAMLVELRRCQWVIVSAANRQCRMEIDLFIIPPPWQVTFLREHL